MQTTPINGIRIYWELDGGTGEPIVLVHGSWGDHHNWAPVVPALSRSFRVLTYDRRGHSGSERPEGQGSVWEDVADLAALIEHLEQNCSSQAGSNDGASTVESGKAGNGRGTPRQVSTRIAQGSSATCRRSMSPRSQGHRATDNRAQDWAPLDARLPIASRRRSLFAST
jgi:hypothetical protein